MANSLIYSNRLIDSDQFKNYKHTNNLDTYVQDTEYKKYAFLICWDSDSIIECSKRSNDITNASEHVFLYASEFYAYNIEPLKKFDKSNVTIFCPKIKLAFEFAQVYPWHFWLSDTANLYKHYIPDWFNDLTVDQPKEKYFDVLLGHQRPSRDYLYNYLQTIDQSKIHLSYQKLGQSISQNTDAWICLDPRLQSLCNTAYDSSHPIIYNNSKYNLSQFIDVGIYNTSAYTVIAETNTDNIMSWFTEKTAKPILAKRLFLALANQGFLSELRKLGFRTFDGIIDESYDNESDVRLRAKLIVEQMKFLMKQDQLSIFEKIKPIVEHNYQVIQTIDYPGDINTISKFFKF
jgi:hypothetical protein